MKKSYKIIALLFISTTSLPTLASSFRTMTTHPSLTVYCGAMCSGKSGQAIDLIDRFTRGRVNIGAFKLKQDDRILQGCDKDPLQFITSRNGRYAPCTAVENIEEIAAIVAEKHHDVIAIDEAQFFEKQALLNFVQTMLIAKKEVFIFGLDLDFRGESFGAMGDLCAQADEIIKLKTVCTICGTYTHCITQRLVDGQPAHYNDPIIMVGDIGYEPRCRNCHIIRKD